ncbi:hypothetical protein [Comamonas thiooxydans]|uniref:hypothetical protein n=1 Tax=Comamonas thiooxydans TaxID=363952 RepID=UPI001554F246|nr:hypothetical protein [Comamonas thiooxydans]
MNTTRQPSPAFTNLELKLLNVVQWLLVGFALFCLVGATMLITLTPEAWPL